MEAVGTAAVLVGCRDWETDLVYGPELRELLRQGAAHHLRVVSSRRCPPSTMVLQGLGAHAAHHLHLVSPRRCPLPPCSSKVSLPTICVSSPRCCPLSTTVSL